MIGYAEGRHFQFARAFDERIDPALAIKQGKFAMDVEMDEVACHGLAGCVGRYGFPKAKDSRIIALDCANRPRKSL